LGALSALNSFNFESYAEQQFKYRYPMKTNADSLHDNINKSIPKGGGIKLRTSGRMQDNR
jgi:hypothetical protein